MKTVEQNIEELGWNVEVDTDYRPHWSAGPTATYRAYQGGFKTLWRPTPEQCLQDVEKIVNARKDPANKRVPF